MEYMYACMLLHKVGKEINEANIKKVLEAAGVKVEDIKVKAVVAALDGVDIEKVVKEASIPTAAPVAEAKKEEKKEKPKEEEKKSEEQAAAGLSSLFG